MAKGQGGRSKGQGPQGGAPGMNQMMKQVQKMQADMAAAQDALAQATVEGSAGGGMVKVVVTGSGEVQSVRIAPEVVDPEDVEMLEDLVLAAVAEAQKRAAELYQAEVRKLASGLPFPFQLPL